MIEYPVSAWWCGDMDECFVFYGAVLVLGIYRYLWKVERLDNWEKARATA